MLQMILGPRMYKRKERELMIRRRNYEIIV
jgi:hypothetical protein